MGRPRLLKSPELSEVPIARYFVVVGSVLAVLLSIAGWSLPEPPPIFPDRPEIIERATIRIRSERKWPDKVVLDTNQPTFSSSSIEVARAQESVEHLPDEMMDQTSVESLAKSMAKPKPNVQPIVAYHPPMRAKRKKARAVPSFHVARVRSPNELQALGEGCCWFEPMDGRTTWRAGSRKRVARRDSWTGWHLPEAD
jgi:hypothetical protein